MDPHVDDCLVLLGIVAAINVDPRFPKVSTGNKSNLSREAGTDVLKPGIDVRGPAAAIRAQGVGRSRPIAAVQIAGGASQSLSVGDPVLVDLPAEVGAAHA